MRTLLLTPWATPFAIVSWETAVRLIYTKKAESIVDYDEDISSPSVTWKMPAVIRLKKPLAAMKRGVKFSRVNLFQRDQFKCQYCGSRRGMRELNYDHVVPRVKGGKTEWTNIATACYDCNERKGGRTPEEAGMKLRQKPYKPKTLPMSYLALDRKTIPEEWQPFCGGADIEEDKDGLYLINKVG